MKTNTEKQAKWIWTIVLAVAFTIMFFARSGEAVKAADVVEFNGTTFDELRTCINSSNGKTIKLMNDVTFVNSDSNLDISRKAITLDLNGHIINRNLQSASSNGYVIKLSLSSTLSIIDSSPNTDHSSYPASLGAISFSGGGIIGGWTSGNGGGIHVILSSRLLINGGTIAYCNAGNGGGVYVKDDSSFEMNGGTITSCTASGSNGGGGVFVYNHSDFKINGGTITSCTASGNGGGVYVGSQGNFLMQGGAISRCISHKNGGGVCNRAIFSMSSGSVDSCSATNGGGIYNTSRFTMTGGVITSCTATEKGGGIYSTDDTYIVSTVSFNGGTVASCTAPDGADIFSTNPSSVTVTSGVFVREGSINTAFVFDGTDKQLLDESVVSATGSAISVKYAVSETNNRPESEAFTEGFPVKTYAGTYYVWYLITNSSTPETIEGGPLVMSIGQATPQFATPPAGVSDLTANGIPHPLITSGSPRMIGSYTPDITYAVTNDNQRPANGYSSEIPSEKTAGTYYVWYRIEGTRNWTAANSFDPITVVIAESAPGPAIVTPVSPDPAPVIATPIYDPEPVAEVAKEEPKPAIFTRKNKDGSVTTITIIRNADGTMTTKTENKYPDGSTETKSETRDAKGNGTLSKTKTDADGNILSKTEGTIKVNKKGTETIKSVTENSDGSKEEKTQKTYKRDADNIKKVTADTRKTDAEGNHERIKMTAFVDGLGAATITEDCMFTFSKTTENTSDGKRNEEAKNGASGAGNVVKEERQYSLSANGRLKLLSLTSDGEKFTTPESIELDGMVRMLKAIGKNALKGNKTIKQVVIGPGVTTICAGAFKNCTNLELIELTGSVKKIYKNAFKGIAKNARFVIEASEDDFTRIVELIKASGVSDTVTFERV